MVCSCVDANLDSFSFNRPPSRPARRRYCHSRGPVTQTETINERFNYLLSTFLSTSTMKIAALLAAGALALCAAPTTEARLGRPGRSLNRVRYDQDDDDLGRWGGWNGAAAQAAAMAISGFSQGQLNGPSSGGYNPGFRNYNAPIVRLANDEDDDDLGRRPFRL